MGAFNFLINFWNSFIFHLFFTRVLGSYEWKLSFQHEVFTFNSLWELTLCVNYANVYFCYYEKELHLFSQFCLIFKYCKVSHVYYAKVFCFIFFSSPILSFLFNPLFFSRTSRARTWMKNDLWRNLTFMFMKG